MEAALYALLAPVAGGRRYWGRSPQGTTPRPFIVLQHISEQRSYHYQGDSKYVADRVQIDIYGDSYTTVMSSAKQVKAILSGHRSLPIMAIFIDAQRNLPAADPGEVTHLFRTSIDIIIHHQET